MRKHCKPCEEGAEKLSTEEVARLHVEVPEWQLNEEGTQISRRVAFKDFAKALAFANEVGRLAEQEWHHPTLIVGWGEVTVSFMTHSLQGLSENDFVMAKRVDELLAGMV